MQRSGIVLAGTVILDVVNIIDHWPQEEHLANILRSEYGAGGPPHNAAAALIRLKAPFKVKLIGAVGDDPYGEIFQTQALGYGLDTSCIQKFAGAITSHTHVMTAVKTGKRTFFHQAGANDLLEVDGLLPRDSNAKIYYLGAPGIAAKMDSNDGWVHCLEHAKASGFITALELVSMPAFVLQKLVPPCLIHTDILVINDHEASSITGIEVAPDGVLNVDATIDACQKLLDMGVSQVVAIHHPQGAVAKLKTGLMEKRGAIRVKTDEIAGSVGAGDAFYAGFLLGWHEGWSLEQCLDLGNAAAATSLFSVTTSAGIRSAKDCLAFAFERGIHNL
jgi:sugar/nucleoside kinase (ribokinase family)